MYNPEIHHRNSIRLRGFDYSNNGAYFVTICAQGRECLFGGICQGEMILNEAGRMVTQIWTTLSAKFPEIILGEFVVMPNHFHGIIVITDVNAHGCNKPDVVGALLAAPAVNAGGRNKIAVIAENKGAASSAPTLGKIMRTFKSISAIEVNRILDRQGQPLWQRNYYERIIRDENEFASISEYIALNPISWAEDKENPDLPKCE